MSDATLRRHDGQLQALDKQADWVLDGFLSHEQRLEPFVTFWQEPLVTATAGRIRGMRNDKEKAKASFARRLNEACDDAEIPAKGAGRQIAVAKLAGVSQKGARKWLEGEAIPATSRISTLAKKLNVNADWLLFEHGEKRSEPKINSPQAVTLSRNGGIAIPLLDVRASMGHGYPVPEHDTVIDNIRLSEDWCRKNLAVSNLKNLAALSAYGDSMRPTFDDGDILLVDTGVNELKIDAVYVLQFRDELYVKRVQRRPDGHIVVKSDNTLYDPFVIDPSQNHLAVLGRVVWAWNGKKL